MVSVGIVQIVQKIEFLLVNSMCSCPWRTFGANMERSGFGTSWGQVSIFTFFCNIKCYWACLHSHLTPTMKCGPLKSAEDAKYNRGVLLVCQNVVSTVDSFVSLPM